MARFKPFIHRPNRLRQQGSAHTTPPKRELYPQDRLHARALRNMLTAPHQMGEAADVFHHMAASDPPATDKQERTSDEVYRRAA